ncbi:MAG: thioredoxin family protein [Synechococcus sp.]
MDRTLVKFSSTECGICHKMSFFDEKVSEELGLRFIDIKLQDGKTYRQYRDILISRYPDKSSMGWPTYFVCDEPEGDFKILGEIRGGHMKGEFRKRVQGILDEIAAG